MCGICMSFFSSQCDPHHVDKLKATIHMSGLKKRGPDVQNSVLKSLNPDVESLFYGTTLHFRGEVTTQPLYDEHENLLLWNGEIFDGIEVGSDENDGRVLLNKLSECQDDSSLLNVFSQIHGPWAFIYWQESTKKLWFGRDIFGRRSLLSYVGEDGAFCLSSIAIKPLLPWKEVPAVGIFCMTFKSSLQDKATVLYPWAEPVSSFRPNGISSDVQFTPHSQEEKSSQSASCSSDDIEAVACSKIANESQVLEVSSRSIFNKTLMSQEITVGNQVVTMGECDLTPPIGAFNRELPSGAGSLDSVSSTKCMGSLEGISSIDSLATEEQRHLAERLVEILERAVKTRTTCQSDMCSECIQLRVKQHTHQSTSKLHSTCDIETRNIPGTSDSQDNKSKSLNIHVCSISSSESTEPQAGTNGCGHTRVAVLFSGGIDSLMIAALADRSVPRNEPIDLLNVAFEQQPKRQQGAKPNKKESDKEIPSFEVPDRVTGWQGLAQLQAVSPHRCWNFVQIDISLKELQTTRADCVRDLVYPLSTVLDDSIGCAIWFAARGQGVITSQSGDRISYTSPARVVLVGMGADEQLAGYSRHRAQFNNAGWTGLIDEIQMEIERISSRNLGRDDRVISDHSRESRFPFLDENVVSFLNSLPLTAKANLHLPRGVGEKFLLRLAAEELDLKQGAMAPKRAIQFGSRIAKAENRKEKGTDSCDRLD